MVSARVAVTKMPLVTLVTLVIVPMLLILFMTISRWVENG
jgi:hypothetical protein